MTFARERIRDVWPEIQPLLRTNNYETGSLHGVEFAPDADRYWQLEDAGIARIYTMRYCARLVGYACFFVSPHLHYPRTVWALQDVLFVLRDHRGGSAVMFVEWTDDELRADGVDFVLRHVSEKRDYSRTLDRMGYEPVDTSFMRRL